MSGILAELACRIDTKGARRIAVTFVRNELTRLPAWLDYYRRLGIERFAVIDNGSTDGTYEYLAAQGDVCLARDATPFDRSNFGIDWLNELHGRLAPGTWVLYADADEFLVFRDSPHRSLAHLCNDAAREDATAVLGFMLDMYPDGPLEEARLAASADPFVVAPCFDADYQFQIRSRKPWDAAAPVLEVIGGPRVRMLSSLEREKRATWLDHFWRGQIDRVLPLVSDALVPWVVRLMPRQMPSLVKTPLTMTGAGVRYVNAHDVTGARPYRESSVFCHFKFLADFAARVRIEAARGTHYRRGAEYIMYADAIAGRDTIDLRYRNTQRFEGPQQLVELGLIRDIRPYFTGAKENTPEAVGGNARTGSRAAGKWERA